MGDVKLRVEHRTIPDGYNMGRKYFMKAPDSETCQKESGGDCDMERICDTNCYYKVDDLTVCVRRGLSQQGLCKMTLRGTYSISISENKSAS